MNYIKVCRQGNRIVKAITGASLGLMGDDSTYKIGDIQTANGKKYKYNGNGDWSEVKLFTNAISFNGQTYNTYEEAVSARDQVNAATNINRKDYAKGILGWHSYMADKRAAEANADILDEQLNSNTEFLTAENAQLKANAKTNILSALATHVDAGNSAGLNFANAFSKGENGSISVDSGSLMAGGAQVASQAFNALDQGLMGDKNFGAQSQAIDSAVHGVSGALMKSGNPYAMAAGAAIEGANFLTKAGGQTVQGFDVDINSSGYGNLGHKDSTSSRDFGAMMGLGGLNSAKMDRMLANRNEQALMALKAANVADTIKYEQEARMNSVDDVIRQNEIALSGGIDTSLLAN